MALKHGSVKYTKWVHVENGRTLVRRIHRLEVQDSRGRLHGVLGTDLPDTILTFAGQKRDGGNLAQILLNPKAKSPYTPPIIRAWPDLGDVATVGLVVVMLTLLRFVYSVAF